MIPECEDFFLELVSVSGIAPKQLLKSHFQSAFVKGGYSPLFDEAKGFYGNFEKIRELASVIG